MKWLQETNEERAEVREIDSAFYKLRNWTIDKNKYSETIITHFFACMGKGVGVLNIPIPNNRILKKVENEIAPFFKKVMLEEHNGTIKSVQVEDVDPNRINITRIHEYHEIIQELYNSEEEPVEFPISNKKIYKIDSTYFKKREYDQQIKNLFSFLREVFSEEELFFSPYGWHLSDNLKNKDVLSCFVNESKKVYLWVDGNTSKILFLQVIFN